MEQTDYSTSGARDDPCSSVIGEGVSAVTKDDGEIGKKSARYDPSLMRDKSKATTGRGALLHLIKSSLGTGILAMPNAFKNGGLIFSLIGTAAVGVLCTHCIYLLVHCSQTLARRTRKPALGFAATADAAFSNGPSRFHAWAPFAREFVNIALFCTYYFGACVYVILVATTFKQVAENHTPPEWHFPIRIWILSLALPLLPLGIIRSLRLLVPFSAVATTFILVGLGCTLISVIRGESPFASKEAVAAAIPLPDIGSRPWIAPIGHMPLFFATVLFAMEGIGTVLPIENSMSNPRVFLRGYPCGVLYACMTLVVFLYSTVGFLGYLRFGDFTEGSITLNLANDLFAEVIKIMVALSILFSYGLQFCVPSEIVWTRLEPWLRKPKQNIVNSTCDNDPVSTVSTSIIVTTDITSTSTKVINDQVQPEIELEEQKISWAYYAMRGSMILGTVCIATLVPNLAPFISLIGAVFFSILGLFCPAVIHLATFWGYSDENDDDNFEESEDSSTENDCDNNYQDHDRILDSNPRQDRRIFNPRCQNKGLNRLTIAKDIVIILIAFIALVTGTYVSMIDILAFPSQKFFF